MAVITGSRRGAAILRVDGVRETIKRLDDVGERARRPEPALRHRSTTHDITMSERRKFTSQKGWKRLTRRWVQEKRRRGLRPQILQATGRLMEALTTADKAQGIRLNVYNAELRWGIRRGRSNLYYAQALAKGTSRMKARQMVVIDEPAVDSIRHRLEMYIAEGVIRGFRA